MIALLVTAGCAGVISDILFTLICSVHAAGMY